MVNFTVRKQQRFSVLLRSMEDLYLVIFWFFLWFLRSAARKTFLFQPSYNLVVVCYNQSVNYCLCGKDSRSFIAILSCRLNYFLMFFFYVLIAVYDKAQEASTEVEEVVHR